MNPIEKILEAKRSHRRMAEMKQRQAKAIELEKTLKELYAKREKNPFEYSKVQIRKVDDCRQEYATKAKELMEEYMQKEIDILTDEKLKLQNV